MADKNHEFRVSAKEFEYLKHLPSLDALLARILGAAEVSHGDKVILRMSHTEAERLRDYLTMQLATIGFNEDYSVNDAGRICEELIDRFFL